MTKKSQSSDLSKALEQIKELNKEVKSLQKKTTPTNIAKAIDSSYLSINNLRGFLQILSLIMTIFISGSIYFASVGLTNILKIREEASKSESIREKTEQTLIDVTCIKEQISNKVQTVDEAIPKIESRTDAEINKLNEKVNKKITVIDKQVKNVESRIKDISQIFSKIGVSNPDLLNAREQQLLFILAQECDPSNPIYNYNAAQLAMKFRRYDETINYLKIVLASNKIPEDILNKAKELMTKAETLKANPPKLQYQEAGGVTVGPYGIVAFPANILNILIQNGYLTLTQAQEVIDASKRKE